MRRNLKRWVVLFTVAALCAGMAAPMHVFAAEKAVSVSDDANVLVTENVLNEVSPITVYTTQRCSIWSAPATAEENRVKYVDGGYQITVYPEVVESTLGDGKTFYRTIRGAYILCRCVDNGSGAESGNGTVVVPSAATDFIAALGLSEAPVGSIITFGSYEQDNNPANGKEPIEWYVLDKSDGQMLLVSVKLLDSMIYGIYDTSGGGVSWETCTLRSWLNNDFYNEAFSVKEKTVIADSYVVNVNNPHYGTRIGNDTTDKVFCLSFGELETYFHIDSRNRANMSWEEYCTYCYNQDHRILAAPTEYAHEKGAYALTRGDAWFYSGDVSYAIGSGNWWLRSPGYDVNYAARVDVRGGVDTLGRSVAFTSIGVRPALRVIYE